MEYKKSVTFNKYNSDSGVSTNADQTSNNPSVSSEPVISGDLSSNHDSDYSGSVSGVPRPRPVQSHWCTRPVHLEKGRDSLSNGDLGTGYIPENMALAAMANRHSSESLNGTLTGVSPSGSKVRSSPPRTASEGPHSALTQDPSMDHLAREFFPLTLGASYTLRSIDPAKTAANSSNSPPKGLPKPNPTPWKPKRSRSPSRKSRPGSAHSSSSSNSKSSIDKMYLMFGEAPAIGSSTVLLSSPYQCELARLRMDRLKIEEEHLLEVKRREELERIRGPQPKWYEMKSPRFHYEAHKNTEVLKSKNSWQDLMDYRGELEKASKQYQQTYKHS